jgi:hypothetical protein
MAATSMWVKSLPVQPQLTGRYELLPGRDANGQAVWRQSVGPGWIYSSQEGIWFVTVHEHCVGKTGGIIGGLAAHGGKPPQDWKDWKRWGGPVSGWVSPDTSVVLTASAEEGAQIEAEKAKSQEERLASLPASLVLQSPSHAQLSGTYQCSSGRIHNSQPLWCQTGGSGLLFADSFGFWRIADGEAGLEEGSGVIQSADISPTAWPQTVLEWKRKSEGGESETCVPGEWVADSNISISA